MIAARLRRADGFTSLAGPPHIHSVVSGMGNVHVTTLITTDAVRRNLLRQVFFLSNTDTMEAVLTKLPPRKARLFKVLEILRNASKDLRFR